MTFEFSCCRYIYNIELHPNKVYSVRELTLKNDFLAKGSESDFIYRQRKGPRDFSGIIPSNDDPVGTKASADKDCNYLTKRQALMEASCNVETGWRIYMTCTR